jgi:hypothetical protein
LSEKAAVLDTLTDEFLSVRQEIADALTLEAAQTREAGGFRTEHERLITEQERLQGGDESDPQVAAERSDFQKRCAALLKRQLLHREKCRALAEKMRALKRRLLSVLERFDILLEPVMA